MIVRKGFTLVEMLVTLVILVIFTTLLVPIIAGQNQAQASRNFMPQLLNLGTFAKQQAILHGVITTLTYHSANNQVSVTNDVNVDPNQPGDSTQSGTSGGSSGGLGSSMTGQTPIVNPNSQTQNQTAPTINQTAAIPSGLSADQFQVNGKTVDGGDWKINFYPDGTSDGGTIEFKNNEAESTFSIDSLANLKVADGPPPDPTTIQWQGGQIEQRQ